MAGAAGRRLSGETDLVTLIAAMRPVLHAARYRFETGHAAPPDAFAIIHEDEATTIIAPAPDGNWARISLSVHSSLSAVGLSAAIAKALADRGISANIVAGYYHDHIFVQWDKRHEAMSALHILSETKS
ncbi:ACT domain-containing protein [Sphingobium boeckii]|uniref:Aspartate kinase n=1 Tax=Sphingobium boeckii TaxID=1082345 RepID=A0A7W9AHN9_9SPHN|nr:ACT domain-containing protein [Sphingobium boeckii]MBB5685606.1 hypothetical protein [Sphingobium boeckii]